MVDDDACADACDDDWPAGSDATSVAVSSIVCAGRLRRRSAASLASSEEDSSAMLPPRKPIRCPLRDYQARPTRSSSAASSGRWAVVTRPAPAAWSRDAPLGERQ